MKFGACAMPLAPLIWNDNGEVVFKIPPAQVELTSDGMYKISIGDKHQYVSSSHLIDEHIIQLERIYRKAHGVSQ